MSKVSEDIKRFLDWEDIKFKVDGENTEREIFFFGVQGNNILKLLFTVENDANVVQFKLWDVLDDEEKNKLKDNKEIVFKLYEYLLKQNYLYKLGKWALDPNDYELNFVIAHHEETEKGLDKSLLKMVKSILFNSGDEMLTEIKNIINGGSNTTNSSNGDDLEELIAKLKKETDNGSI